MKIRDICVGSSRWWTFRRCYAAKICGQFQKFRLSNLEFDEEFAKVYYSYTKKFTYDERNFYDACAFIVSLTFTYIHICRDKCRKMYFHNGGCECYLVYNISDMSRMYYECNVKGCFSGRLFCIFRVSVMSYNIVKLFWKWQFFCMIILICNQGKNS